MKITKAKLKQIIKEELSTLSEHGDWFDKENETRADKKFRDRQEIGGKQVDMTMLVNLVVDERLASTIKKYTGIEVADADIANALAAVVGWRNPDQGTGFKIVTKHDWEF